MARLRLYPWVRDLLEIAGLLLLCVVSSVSLLVVTAWLAKTLWGR